MDDSDIVAKAIALACGTVGSLHEEKHTTAITTTATTAGAPLQQYLDLRFSHNCADERSSNRSDLDFRIQINAFKNNSHSNYMSP